MIIVLVIRALVSCYYGALRGCEPHVGLDSDINETAAYPERPADNQVLQFVRRDADEPGRNSSSVRRCSSFPDSSTTGAVPGILIVLPMPECSARRGDWRHCVGLSVTAAGVLKECDFSEADSVTFLLARGFSGHQGAPEEIGRT
jgi:hypothetical protein